MGFSLATERAPGDRAFGQEGTGKRAGEGEEFVAWLVGLVWLWFGLVWLGWVGLVWFGLFGWLLTGWVGWFGWLVGGWVGSGWVGWLVGWLAGRYLVQCGRRAS